MKSWHVLCIALWVAGCTAQFSDEMQTLDEECLGEEKFPCMSGGCVDIAQHCDGLIDCTDGSDENFCLEHRPDAEFCNETHQFMCRDERRCIPNQWICNNETDCDDGSDETNCTEQPELTQNSNCKGFLCSDGKCISRLWVCDGAYDCNDKSDENNADLCRHSLLTHNILDGVFCNEMVNISDRSYKCLDSSLCLPGTMMCDGMQDCKDGSDEGPFCINWHTMCTNFSCPGNGTFCSPERHGPTCFCMPHLGLLQYNNMTRRCDDIDECLLERPQCSHHCHNKDGHFVCECEEGYIKDQFGYLCYSSGPEAMLFLSTRNSIQYLKVKSKELVTLVSGVKNAHGVSSDGTYLYWVETAHGHQSIFRAQLNDVQRTKKVIVGLGLEDPGDVAVDFMGGHIYFSDSARGVIFVCHADGLKCTTIHTETKRPRFVTLDPKNGQMYWSDWHHRAVIMTARMDGSDPQVLVDELASAATGLALDAPNHRLYFVEKTIKVVMLDARHVYSLFEEPFHHPFSIAVFENTVYWSDWTSNTIQTTDKIHGGLHRRNLLMSMETPVIGMHIYHPVLMRKSSHPCHSHPCSHFCFITSSTTYSCGCPDTMERVGTICKDKPDYRPQFLIVGGGQFFTKIQYDSLGSPESHTTKFDIGRVQAMAYDFVRDTLYIYDGQRRILHSTNMSVFTHGKTRPLIYHGLENVVDMDYDYVSDALYILDAGRRSVEVLSLSTLHRALVYRFKEQEIPIAMCVLSDYGKMLVAVVESEEDNAIHVDSITLDGDARHHVIMNNLKGPHVRLRYAHEMDIVYVSDEGNGVIDYMHPEGTGRENFRELSTTVTSLAITDTFAFWTDRRTPRLFWADVHDTLHKIRRIELSIFPNNTQLLIQATSPPPDPKNPLLLHPCKTEHPCSHICVQTAHTPQKSPPHYHLGYKCLCPPGLLLMNGRCSELVHCTDPDLYCHKSNHCFHKSGRCDGKLDCVNGEDEEGCIVQSVDTSIHPCNSHEILCNNMCVDKKIASTCAAYFGLQHKVLTPLQIPNCSEMQFQCHSGLCIDRSQVCDRQWDCPDGIDEASAHCDTLACLNTEFMCSSGSCILKTWKCDGDQDCNDASDEIDCENMTCAPGFYQCRNRECIELKRRCDGHQDCFDFSDEEDCDEPVIIQMVESAPRCADWEYTCELNTSICLPHTARCNMKIDCPGGTDESDCQFRCGPHGMFSCKQQALCLPTMRVCDNKKDCIDGSDETPDACALVNKTSHLYPSMKHTSECHDGYLCANGQCIEWRDVCDNTPNCYDGSDEGGHCSTACSHNICAHECQRTPLGPQCICPAGYRAVQGRCEDIDECLHRSCSQTCTNIPGSFVCSCHHGYALRSDRRSCKAYKGNMSILYVSDNTVRSISADGYNAVEYSDSAIGVITDLDFNVRKNKLYVSSAESGKLIEVNGTHNVVTVTNVGKPTKVAVDWVTGNVYFADNTQSASYIRVCNVGKKRCARLQKLPSNSKVTALIVEPASRRMFYCVVQELESVVWSSSLSGRHAMDLAPSHNCTGLAADSFTRRLYVAETGPPHIITMDFDGGSHKKILAEHPQLQAPHGLAIFEDYIFYIVANSYRLSRCVLYGPKHCETYIYRAFDANTFVIRHEAVQRDDLRNDCERLECSNICTLDEHGPVCVCDDGSFAKDGSCALVETSELPLFNGWSRQDSQRAHHASFTVIVTVLVLFALYVCLFVYYHFVYKLRKNKASPYTEVRYQTKSDDDRPFICNSNREMGINGSTNVHEFVNPLEYVRNAWQQSFRKKSRPIGTAGLSIDVSTSPQQNLSDTESDLDDRETKRFIRK